MSNKVPRYIATKHVCRACGSGRIMQQTNSGPTGGGNPVWRCMTCLNGGAAITPKAFCYCGFHRLPEETNWYQCWDIGDGGVPDGWREFRTVYNLSVIRSVRRFST